MKKVLKIIAGALVGLVVLFVVVGFLLPGTAHVERTATVKATTCNVFHMVNGFTWFNEYSPWAARDPATVYTHSGPTHGVGAKMTWKSDNPEVGSGSQTITASKPCERIDIDLDFGDQGTAKAFWTFAPDGPNTEVTWGFDTDFGLNIIARYFGLMFDGMIGPDYEKGIEMLGAIAERLPKADIGGLRAETVELEARPVAVMSSRSASDAAATRQALAAALGQVDAWLGQAGLTKAGAPVAITQSHDDTAWMFEAGIPFSGQPPEQVEAPIVLAKTPAGRMLKVVHTGSYDKIGDTHGKIDAYEAIFRLERSGVVWEEYVSDPRVTPEDKLVTHIFIGLK